MSKSVLGFFSSPQLMCRVGLVGLTIAGLTIALSSPVSAQQRIGASPQVVSTFLANPSEVINRSPTGGADLVSSVRDLVTADPATLQPILNLLANTNKDQKASIGAGLAQAARIVVRTNPAFATQIQQAILETKDQDVVIAFAAAAGDRATGAVGGGGGGAGGGSGGQVSALPANGGGGGGIESIGGAGINTPNFSYTSAVGGVGGVLGAGNTTNTVSNLVSP